MTQRPWRSLGQGGPFYDEGPGDEAEASRVFPSTVIGMPACTVARSYHGKFLSCKYAGEREGERLAFSKCREAALFSRT